MAGAAHNPNTIIDQFFELQPVYGLGQAFRSEDQIDLTPFQQGPKLMH